MKNRYHWDEEDLVITRKDIVDKGRFGSRSEAGRYAAEQRWKGHVTVASKTIVNRLDHWAKDQMPRYELEDATIKMFHNTRDAINMIGSSVNWTGGNVAKHVDSIRRYVESSLIGSRDDRIVNAMLLEEVDRLKTLIDAHLDPTPQGLDRG